jgi:iron complex outermembrane receptor protein
MINFKGKNILLRIAIAGSIAAVAGIAPATFAAEGEGATLEEIIVTSRKREEALLEAPLTITAFGAKQIEKMALDELPDFANFTPGFHYSEHSVGKGGRFNRRLIFRGMNPRTDRQTRQGATVFIDGAPTLGSEIGSAENYERIEIIKGPQSAYFGRSTFSGAINAVTKTPGDEWAGKISAEVGSFGLTDFGAQVEGSLIEDVLSMRLSARQYETHGEYTNSGDPTVRLGAESTSDISLSLFARPTDKLSAKFRIHAWTDDDGPSVGAGIAVSDHPGVFDCNVAGNAAGGGKWLCGDVPFLGSNQLGMDTTITPAIQAAWYNQGIQDAWIFDAPRSFGLERNAREVSLVLDYEMDNGMTISSVTASHKNEYGSFEDFDRRVTAGQTGTAFGAVSSAETYNLTLTSNKDFSQEFRLTSSDDNALTWMVGASYSEIEARLQGFSVFGGRSPNPNQSVSTFDPETRAIFAALSYQISDTLELSLEARNQRDKVVEGTLGKTPLENTFTSTTPRVILDYKPKEGTTYYFTYAKGVNPGQFNAGLLGRNDAELAQIAAAGGGGISVQEESITNIEFGAKSRFWDDRAQITAAIYFADWEDAIAPEIITIVNAAGDGENIQVNSNGGQADLSGLEVEGSFLLSDNWTIDMTFALNKSEINDFESPDAAQLFGSRTIDGMKNAFSRYPETSGTLSATYEATLKSGRSWYFRGDYISQGKTWMTNANVTSTDEYSLINVRVGLESDDWSIEGYVTNLMEEEGYTNLQLFPDLSGQSGRLNRMILAGLIPQRSIGVRTSFEF